MSSEIIKDLEERMTKAISVLKSDLATLRAGRATPALVEKVSVEYYGTPTPVNQLANISAPEARLLVIQPWDKTAIGEIEKAILKSDLGLTPSNDGVVIRLAIPQLTEERRGELVKVVKKKAEECKVAVRNVRRDVNDHVKAEEKSGSLTEDDAKRTLDEIQKLTDKYVKEIDVVASRKEQDIMEV